MKNILQFIPVQLTFFLVVGIIFGYKIDLKISSLYFLLPILLLVLGISFSQSKKAILPKLHFNFVTYLLMVFIGFYAVSIRKPINNPQHYSHFITDENKTILSVEEVLKEGLFNQKYYAEVKSVDGKSTNGKVLLNLPKDSLFSLQVDDKIYLKSSFKEPNKSKNPYQFDYKQYLEKNGVYHQIFAKTPSVLKLERSETSIEGLAFEFRKKINKALEKNGFKGDELGVINALLLGQRQDISKELIESYAGAGAIHILAVSGLHVGIILLILNFLLRPLERLKNGKFIKLILLVGLLWAFAFIAGMSASIVRAVTMFTAVAIGVHVNKRTNVYNTLTMSMFFLLLFRPSFLFDVGFQLSYLAVFTIVWLQPMFSRIWKPKFKLLNYFWNLLTVSFAAQIGVLPLSLYYFHQFPSLFFISNVFIIPILGIILGLGILVIILALFNILPSFLADVLNFLISYMNSVIKWVAGQEYFLFKNLTFSLLMVVATYLLFTFFFRFFQQKKPMRFVFLLLSILVLQGVLVYQKNIKNENDVFIVFHKSKYTLLGERNGEELYVSHNLDSLSAANDKVISQYDIGSGKLKIQEKKMKNVYQFKNDIILLVDSLNVYQINDIKPSIVVLQQSPKVNLKRVIDSLQPKLIIADGSNYKSYVKKWKETCEQKNTPFHSTLQKGAYILKE